MTSRYVIGGVGFTADRPLEGLNDSGFCDLEVTVAFSDNADREIRGPNGTWGTYDADTSSLVLPDAADPKANGWFLRQIAPVVSSLERKVVLHASAVRLGDAAVAFVAGSGTGKSTLAAAFAHPLADDLTPVRFTPEAHTRDGETLIPLSAVCFLARDTDVLAADELDPAVALDTHIRNGFGEHADPQTWAFQFDAYHRLATTLPHFDLTIPDDLARLGDVVAFVEGLS